MTTNEPGTEIAGYRITSLIGRGGMAVVYCAKDMRLGRKVALKLLSPQLADNEQFRQRFIRESQLAASLDHPNIIPIYEAGQADGQLFIAMRYVQGSDVKALMAQQGGQLPVEWVVQLFSQIGDALDAAHRAGLVHRDVKPANVLVAAGEHTRPTHGDHAYLTDFGVTKRTSEMSGGLTGTGNFLGTVDYVSPEQIQGKPVAPTTDIYALGCMLYECLTGRLPYRRDDDAALLWAHLVEPPPAVTATRPELPVAVDAVVARAMAKDPAERYQSCAELVDELELALGVPAPVSSPETRPTAQPPVPQVPEDLASTSAAAAPPPWGAAPAPAETPGPPGRRKVRTLAISAVALVVLAAALVGVILVTRGSPSRQTLAVSGPTAAGTPSSVSVGAPTPSPTPSPAPIPAPSLAPAAAVGVFSGLTKTSGIGISFALDGGNASAYVCDGRKFEIWMHGTVNGDQVTMTGPNSSLTGVVNQQQLSGRIMTPKGPIDFLAHQARPPAGVYKAEITINGQDAYFGWAVLPDGTQLGAVNSGQSVTPAPPLTINVTGTSVTATFSVNGTSHPAEVVTPGQPLWPDGAAASPTS
jgi:serine/threonine protein kinase